MEDMSIGLMPPPKLRDDLPTSNFKPNTLPKQRVSSLDLKNLPRTPVQRFYKNQQQKRQVSMPTPLLNTEKPLHQVYDYTNIIQIYEENSPFGVIPQEQSTVVTPLLNPDHNLSSPEVNSASSASDTASNSSSTYSFVDSTEDDVLSVEPSVITKHSESNFPTSKPKLHPRDSIRYMRNYDGYHDQFEIKTKTPPILPNHTVNVIKKNDYYKSRASFEGEAQLHDPSIPPSPCNERDTSIFTRRSRKLPPLPDLSNDKKTSINTSLQQHKQQTQPFQLPGYQGGLRVVNRVPS